MAKILIGDDEAHIRLLLEQTLEDLEDEGVEILSCGDGKDALEIIKQEKPRLVLLDVMMPGMNGFEVCRAVKKELNMEGVYIILLTSKGQEFDKKKGEEAGADLYMNKPFDPDTILEKAARVLGLEI
jgi:two-component system alkaline phosphatase synthesis response regulator PhoP